jgi:hypothetical protein
MVAPTEGLDGIAGCDSGLPMTPADPTTPPPAPTPCADARVVEANIVAAISADILSLENLDLDDMCGSIVSRQKGDDGKTNGRAPRSSTLR